MADRRIFLLFFLFSICAFILGQYFSLMLVYIGAMHLAMLSLAIFFLFDKGKEGFVSTLGIPGNLKTNAIYFIVGMVALFATLSVLTITLLQLGINDQSKVVDIANKLPIPVLALAILVAPFSEELFFRGMLMTKIESLFSKLQMPFGGASSILLSSILFGSSHFAYGSVVEILGALSIGIVLALVFKKSGSIIPAIAIHLVYNLISITVLRLYA